MICPDERKGIENEGETFLMLLILVEADRRGFDSCNQGERVHFLSGVSTHHMTSRPPLGNFSQAARTHSRVGGRPKVLNSDQQKLVVKFYQEKHYTIQ